jgi:predicted RNA binding protein YcfA (HicA-like mRNA interferase family)
MVKLPLLSGDEVIKAFKRMGYWERGQKGSHVHLRHKSSPPITIPRHKQVDKGTLRGIIRDAGLTVEEFVNLL